MLSFLLVTVVRVVQQISFWILVCSQSAMRGSVTTATADRYRQQLSAVAAVTGVKNNCVLCAHFGRAPQQLIYSYSHVTKRH